MVDSQGRIYAVAPMPATGNLATGEWSHISAFVDRAAFVPTLDRCRNVTTILLQIMPQRPPPVVLPNSRIVEAAFDPAAMMVLVGQAATWFSLRLSERATSQILSYLKFENSQLRPGSFT
jgi:hypothetical protein